MSIEQVITEFDPAIYAKEELEWLLEALDKPPVIAYRDIQPIKLARHKRKNDVVFAGSINPNAVKPILNKIQDLEQLEKHEGQKWVGKEAVKQAIKTYLAVDAKWEADYLRTNGRAPRFPSLYSYDSKGRPHLGGPGSDSGRVRTYFDENGNRKKFAIDLVDTNSEWSGPRFTEKTEDGLTVNGELSRIDCFCGHTEKFKDGSRSSYNAARARMSKHLRKATEDVERHRELHTNEFGG